MSVVALWKFVIYRFLMLLVYEFLFSTSNPKVNDLWDAYAGVEI